MIIDDYGHHPAEVEATLDAAQNGFDRRVVVAFQPHRYTRTQSLFDDFTRAFNKADLLIVTDVYAAGEQPIAGATGEALAEAIRAHGHHNVRYIGDKKKIGAALLEQVRPGDLVNRARKPVTSTRASASSTPRSRRRDRREHVASRVTRFRAAAAAEEPQRPQERPAEERAQHAAGRARDQAGPGAQHRVSRHAHHARGDRLRDGHRHRRHGRVGARAAT